MICTDQKNIAIGFENLMLQFSIYRLGNIVVASNKEGEPVTADDLVSSKTQFLSLTQIWSMFLSEKSVNQGRSAGSFLKQLLIVKSS